MILLYRDQRPWHYISPKQCFEYKNPAERSDKFWTVEITGNDVRFEWGKRNVWKKDLPKHFNTQFDAQKAVDAKIKEKIREGYLPLECKFI